MNEMKILYECDPEKNIECKRSNCLLKPLLPGMPGECHSTTELKFAKQPVTTVKLVLPMSEEEAAELMTQGNADVRE